MKNIWKEKFFKIKREIKGYINYIHYPWEEYIDFDDEQYLKFKLKCTFFSKVITIILQLIIIYLLLI